jgi:hypothetical protein
MVPLKYVTVWDAAKDAIKVSNGYRGAMQYVYATPARSGRSALRSQGKAVHVDPIKSTFEAPRTKRLNL